jgi:hypothetical protein
VVAPGAGSPAAAGASRDGPVVGTSGPGLSYDTFIQGLMGAVSMDRGEEALGMLADSKRLVRGRGGGGAACQSSMAVLATLETCQTREA